MIHVFRLGPASVGATPAYTYVGVVEGGEPRLHVAPTDAGGLEALRSEALGQLLSCEPALGEAAKALGLEAAPLPPGVRTTRAVLAYELASGVQHGASNPDAIAAFLRGAAAFWRARSWEVVGPQERLHVAFLEGHAEVDGELSVVGGDGMRLPGVALCDARGALQDLARLDGDARAEAALRLATLTVDMEREPAWAADALEEGFGLPRVPAVARLREGGPAPLVTQDLLLAGALLEAIAAWTALEDERAAGEGAAEAAGMRIAARVRASERLPEGVSGLTPVGAAAPVPVPVEAAPPVPAPPEPASPPPPAPAPAAPRAQLVQAARPAPIPVPAPDQEPPQGWLSRAWRSLRGQGASPTRKAAGPSRGGGASAAGPRPRTALAPAARAPQPAAHVAAPPDADPFAPFARALRVELPPPPPPPSEADEVLLAELAARLVEAARAGSGELVAFPAVALEIVERTHDPRADARSVAGFIAREPALAADVVSVANSAAFRGVSEVESVHEAVARLGLAEVGRVASAVAARKLLDPQGGEAGTDAATRLFVRAVAVATAAATAALRQRGARTDHVWLGGLLHDVGRAMALRLQARLAAAPGAHLTPVALTERLVERVHVEVGVAALRQWGLPAYLQEICAHHHDEAVAPEAVDLHLVRLTSALACLGDPPIAARAARELVQSAGALKLDAPMVRALATDLKAAEARARALVR